MITDRAKLLLLLSAVLLIRGVLAVPSPVQCNSTGCTVSFYQTIWFDRTPCKAGKVFYPSTEDELIRAVAHAVQNNLKVKVVSKGSHSTTKLVCPGGSDGVVISTRDYNLGIYVNKTALTVTADAGVQLRDLIDRIAEDGLTLPHTPYWEGVSVAGLISTGAHGSGVWGKGGATHEYVAGMRLVIPSGPEEGYARVVTFTEKDDELNAARLSLGVLGAISQVTFALQPMFKRSVTLEIRDDHNLEEDIELFAKKHEFGGLTWYPYLEKALFKVDDRVGVEVEGNGVYKLAVVNAMPVSVIEGIRSAEEAAEAQRDAQGVCLLSENLLGQRFVSGDGLLNDGLSFQGFPVVGYNHLMQTSGGCQRSGSSDESLVVTATGIETSADCADGELKKEWSTCNWDPRVAGLFFFDTAISIPMSRVKDVIEDIKKFRAADPTAMCGFGMYGGLWLRFMHKSEAYLGEKEDAVVIEFMYYRSREGNTPRFNEDVMEEVEQMLLVKYGGKPHWGKNRDLSFEGMASRTLNLPKFLEVKEKLDPDNFFSSEWSDAILSVSKPGARGVQTLRDYCALEGLCICSQDSHCAPEEGYVCRPGKVYKDARVCRYVDRKEEMS